MNLSEKQGAGRQRVAILPLALMLVLHLMLLLLWPTTARLHREHAAERRFFALTWLPALRPRALPPPAPTLPVAARAVASPRVAAPLASPRASAPRPTSTSAAEPLSIQKEMPQPRPEFPASAAGAVGVPSLIDTAKRQAGLIDRELRGGKLAPLTPDPDLPILHFRRALESAHIDQSWTVVSDSTTQPDGVIVYRFRQGGKVWCRQSGGGTPGMLERTEGAKLAGAGSAGGGSAAGTVPCPGGQSGWSP